MAKTIITVDDAATMRKMIAFTLKAAGYDMIEAEDGLAALNLLKTRSVDLVITDVNMPNMNGIELTRQVRTFPHLAKVPILLLTTESDPAIKNQGRAAGASGWIVKPFKQEQLLAVVGKVLPL
jgi:two-component system chemotaxis response regulator CheY